MFVYVLACVVSGGFLQTAQTWANAGVWLMQANVCVSVFVYMHTCECLWTSHMTSKNSKNKKN